MLISLTALNEPARIRLSPFHKHLNTVKLIKINKCETFYEKNQNIILFF